MRLLQLSCSLALVLMATALASPLKASASPLPKVEEGSKKDVAKASKHFEYLTTQAGYKAIETKLLRSRRELPTSIALLKNNFVYSARVKTFADIEAKVKEGDTETLRTIEYYKRMSLPTLTQLGADRLDGWVAVHRYTVGEGDKVEEKTMLFFLNEKLDDLIDAGEWYGFDYELVVKTLSDLSTYIKAMGDKVVGTTEDSSDIHDVVDTAPEFPEGQQALMKFLSQNISYPEVAAQFGIQGRVIIQFVVDKDGSITNVRIARGVEQSLDLEAIRVVLTMPKWKPGLEEGEAVRTRFTLPIVFRLQ